MVISRIREPPWRSVAAMPTRSPACSRRPQVQAGAYGGVGEHHGTVAGTGAVAQVEVAGAGEELGEQLPHRTHGAGRGVVPALSELAAQLE